MDDKTILELLREDSNYYDRNGIGGKFLSNSDIGALLNNPRQFRAQDDKPQTPLLVGGYLHTIVLEPHKAGNYQIVDATSRNSKAYKDAVEASNQNILLLQHEKEQCHLWKETLLGSDACRSLIMGEGAEFEVPGLGTFFGERWKAKADVLNKKQGVIVDVKTTGDITKFKWSAKKYNYNSAAYLYSQIFGMPMVFVVIDKTTLQLGVYECEDSFVSEGEYKAEKAAQVYQKFYKGRTPDETRKLLANNVSHDFLF